MEALPELFVPNNCLISDQKGRPSLMVRIPKFRVCDVIHGGSTDPHPAFIVNGKEIPEIYVSKYPNVMKYGLAYSLPNEIPTTSLIRDEVVSACESKGKGWHMMTNSEWAALALWSKKNGTFPRGNNDFSRDYYYPHETGVVGSTYVNSKGLLCNGMTLTGSGPVTWAHNHSSSGVYDLNGNVWTQVSGFRVVDGEIQITENNDSALGSNAEAEGVSWKSIAVTGELLPPGSPRSLKFKFDSGRLILVDNAVESVDKWGDSLFNGLGSEVLVPELLKVLAIYPDGTGYGEQKIWVNNAEVHYPWRGGTWDAFQYSGIFCLFICYPAGHISQWSGFRASYIELL
jgi:hypothetical protein